MKFIEKMLTKKENDFAQHFVRVHNNLHNKKYPLISSNIRAFLSMLMGTFSFGFVVTASYFAVRFFDSPINGPDEYGYPVFICIVLAAITAHLSLNLWEESKTIHRQAIKKYIRK